VRILAGSSRDGANEGTNDGGATTKARSEQQISTYLLLEVKPNRFTKRLRFAQLIRISTVAHTAQVLQ
jgi:hypothetical protein